MKTFQLFSKALEDYSQKADVNEEFIGEKPLDFSQRTKNEIEGCKVFSLNDDLKELLLKTDASNELERIPFDKMFIDVSFDVRDLKEKAFGHLLLEVKGILVVKTDEFCVKEGGESRIIKGTGFKAIALAEDDGEGENKGFGFYTFNIPDKDFIKSKLSMIDVEQIKLRETCISFVSNLINMIINKEDIEIVEKEYSPAKNRRLERSGQPRVPNYSVILPVGHLREYINQLKRNINFSYSHKFWVRGHWRTLKANRYKEKVKMWIKPFVKGKGILIDKKYEVELKVK